MASTVDITSFPTARNDATEDKWTKYAQALLVNGVLAGQANEMQVFADSTGMLVKVKTGRCFIDGVAGDLAAQQSLDIETADGSNPRIDRVVARLTTTSPATISVRVVTGTAAASPAAPALLDDATHTDIPLATVRVEALTGTIAAGKVTDGRVWCMPAARKRIAVGSAVAGAAVDITEDSTAGAGVIVRGDTGAFRLYDTSGTQRALIGLRSDISSNTTDVVTYSYGGDIRLFIVGPGEVLRLNSSRIMSVNRELRVGDDPFTGSTPYVRVGNLGDSVSAYAAVAGAGSDYSMVLRSKGNGAVQFQTDSGTAMGSFIPNQGLKVGGAINMGNAQAGVLGLSDIPGALSGSPTSGGYLYVDAGALKFRGSGGTTTTLAPA